MRRWHVLVVSLSLTAGLGCGSAETAGGGMPDDSNIRPLTMLYVSYVNRQGQPPASEAEFKRYLAERGEALLQSEGVSSPDELFISPRDNEPYVLGYGKDADKLMRRGIVVYERTGVGGRRLVGYRGGFVNEVDDAEFRKLVPAR